MGCEVPRGGHQTWWKGWKTSWEERLSTPGLPSLEEGGARRLRCFPQLPEEGAGSELLHPALGNRCRNMRECQGSFRLDMRVVKHWYRLPAVGAYWFFKRRLINACNNMLYLLASLEVLRQLDWVLFEDPFQLNYCILNCWRTWTWAARRETGDPQVLWLGISGHAWVAEGGLLNSFWELHCRKLISAQENLCCELCQCRHSMCSSEKSCACCTAIRAVQWVQEAPSGWTTMVVPPSLPFCCGHVEDSSITTGTPQMHAGCSLWDGKLDPQGWSVGLIRADHLGEAAVRQTLCPCNGFPFLLHACRALLANCWQCCSLDHGLKWWLSVGEQLCQGSSHLFCLHILKYFP